MNEEIIEDNNCIVKAFENNPISILQEQNGGQKIYYFKASDIGKALNLSNIAVSIQNYDEDERVIRKAYDTTNREQNTTFLSSQGVYRLLYSSKKEIAKKFRKWAGAILDDIIFNESKQLQRQLQEQTQLLQLKDREFIVQSKLDKHKLLLEKFSYRKCIYLSEIEEDKIKIGSTNDINMRKNNLKDVFGTCLFLDVFECDYYREIEQNILVAVREHIYKEKINGHLSKEIVSLSRTFNYIQLIRIIKEQIENYNKHIERLQMEKSIEYKKLELEIKKVNYQQSVENHNFELRQLDYQQSIVDKAQSGAEFLEILKEMNKKLVKNNEVKNNEVKGGKVETKENEVQGSEVKNNVKEMNIQVQIGKGRKIQEIDPDNLNVIKKVYKSMIYALRENEGYDKQAIQSAIKENKIYKGSRWLFIEHNEDPNIVNNIKPTVNSNQPENRTILKLNKEKTEILNTFTGVKQMRTAYKMGDTKVYSIIDNSVFFDDGYFVRITDCPKELLEKFEMPESVSKKAKSVKQTNINTNEETIYKSITDLYIKKGISYKKLANIIKNNQVFDNSEWEYVN